MKEFLKAYLKVIGITKIYNNEGNYTALPISNDITFYENSSFSVIGIIDIKKINISYPILSGISKDALKIATCLFYGPELNKIR
ncbi:MAG: hypothetical protein HFJ51_04755 [Clostridia bacterium]|nr:hypothetical protein [Clostridia bacterium]